MKAAAPAKDKIAAGRARSGSLQAHLAASPGRLTPIVLATLAAFGVAISTYLAVTHFGDRPIVCAGLGQCDYVNSSDYASVAGIPVSVLGIFLYAGLLSLASLWAIRPENDLWPIAYWGMALAGAGYAGYLTYVELAILHAICVWCVVSAIVLATSLLLSTAALVRGNEPRP